MCLLQSKLYSDDLCQSHHPDVNSSTGIQEPIFRKWRLSIAGKRISGILLLTLGWLYILLYISGGAAEYETERNDNGLEAWEDNKIIPTVADSNKTEYKDIFTPTEAENYESTDCRVKLIVNKAAIPETTITAPTPKALSYNGWAQQLVEPGSVTGNTGTMKYAVTETEAPAPTDESLYTASLPAATNAGNYYMWYRVQGDDNHLDWGPAMITARIEYAFGPADFILPRAEIEESAFENDTLISIVDAGSCVSIGKNAFVGCTGLKQIRLPANCSIDPDAFAGCGTVYLYAPPGGKTEEDCTIANDKHNNLVFVPAAIQ